MGRNRTHSEPSGTGCVNDRVDCVGDRLWLWCHPAGSHNGIYGLPGASRITPVEACCYLGIRNALMVKYLEYGPSPPFDQFALPFAALDRVVWSIVGASGQTDEQTREAVLELARQTPHITGVIMDDFFKAEGDSPAHLTLDELTRVRRRLRLPDRTLELWVVLYDYMLDRHFDAYLDLCDTVTFWTWEAANLGNLERNFERFEKVAERQSKVLGCYMWDYGNSKPMPLDLMQKQCEFGLEMLEAGRIQGMILLASCICDLGLETVTWTRNWVAIRPS
jgi:hypothetical protein